MLLNKRTPQLDVTAYDPVYDLKSLGDSEKFIFI
jgi:hypothetical protein